MSFCILTHFHLNCQYFWLICNKNVFFEYILSRVNCELLCVGGGYSLYYCCTSLNLGRWEFCKTFQSWQSRILKLIGQNQREQRIALWVAVISWRTTRCHYKLNAQYSIQCYLWALSLTWKVPAIILCRLWHQSMLIGSCYNICMTNDDKAPIGEVPASLLKVPARYHTML